MEGRIRQLEHLLENAEIVEAATMASIDTVDRTIVYEGDDDMAERYLVGHMEEQSTALDVISPSSPLGSALGRRRRGRHGQLRGAERQAHASRSSRSKTA